MLNLGFFVRFFENWDPGAPKLRTDRVEIWHWLRPTHNSTCQNWYTPLEGYTVGLGWNCRLAYFFCLYVLTVLLQWVEYLMKLSQLLI